MAAATLAGCAHTETESKTSVDPPAVKESLSKPQIDALRSKLAKLKFPQAPGTVEGLLPSKILPRMTAIGDMSPNDQGLVADYDNSYLLNKEYVLEVRTGHYFKNGKDYQLENGARIVRRNQLPSL